MEEHIEPMEEEEVIVKGLGTQLARIRNIVGATVLRTGRVVLILNTNDLLKSVTKGFRELVVSSESTLKWSGDTKSIYILVAEDSFTSRSLLQTVLEDAGYQVRTAVDGLEAWLALQHEEFDMVISDIEMPRLNGFDLTARIRANPRLTNLPVVLVTALASEEDRRRGVEVGANAYIIKRAFEQQELLETVARLA